MRKIVLLFFAVLLLFMTVPAMAVSTVDIECEKVVIGDANWVIVSYESDPNRVRAFGLDITVDTNKIRDVCALNANYRIYPGQISIVNDDVNDYKTPYDPCALVPDGNSHVVIEMGSLYTTDPCYATDGNAGYNMIPDLSGQLFKFRVGGDCNYVVDVNIRRGGIVMEDPNETPSIDSPLCSGHVGGEAPPEHYDFGDAPDNAYKTLLASNGPSHLMAGTTTGIGPILGAFIDAEADGQPTLNCDGDDLNGAIPDDEDGIAGLTAVVNEGGNVVVTASATGYLNAWIDWGKDGSFAEVGDQVFTDQPVVAGPNPLGFAVPAGAVKNNLLVSRWRITSYDTPDTDYFGPATDGEVEDYNNLTVVCHVPDVVGEESSVAQGHLSDAGFTIGTITTACDNTVPAGDVISTDPAYCNYPECGSAVDIVVSIGHTVPNVVGDTNAVAQGKITDAGFTIGTITTACSNTIAAGCVISTNPAGGATPACGSAVNMVVSTGLCTYTISGTVSGHTKASVTLGGLPKSPSDANNCVTDANGNYSGTVSYGWSGTVTPAKTGYTFSPVNRSYSSVSSNYTAQNYTATGNPLTISGKVTEGANNLPGVTIVGLPGNPVTGGDGTYTSTAYYGWSGMAMPALGNYTFSPVSRAYSSITANQTAQNYAATAHATDCLKNDPNWVAWGKPNCWCFSRQCRGDADGRKIGFWVSLADFNLLKSAYTKADTVLKNIPNGICADFDHAKIGFRVSLADFNILKSYYTKADTSVPCCDDDKDCVLTTSDKYDFWTN